VAEGCEEYGIGSHSDTVGVHVVNCCFKIFYIYFSLYYCTLLSNRKNHKRNILSLQEIALSITNGRWGGGGGR
jgi:hypothetical protein